MKHPELYPLKFTPYLKRVIWGGDRLSGFKGLAERIDNLGESWEISGLEGFETPVAEGELKGLTLERLIDMYGADLVGETGYRRYGNRFPLLFKFLDVRKDLSVQVHPDEDTAARLSAGHGKYELCYVIESQPGALFYNGFKNDVDEDALTRMISSGSILESLHAFPTSAGDIHYVPAGRIHAIGAGHLLAEIQQSSDITYRIYDYGRIDRDGNPRELHLRQALDSLDMSVPEVAEIDYDRSQPEVKLEQSPWFTCCLVDVDGERDLPGHRGSFIALMGLAGETGLDYGKGKCLLKAGETLLVPACLSHAKLSGLGRILAAYLPENLP